MMESFAAPIVQYAPRSSFICLQLREQFLFSLTSIKCKIRLVLCEQRERNLISATTRHKKERCDLSHSRRHRETFSSLNIYQIKIVKLCLWNRNPIPEMLPFLISRHATSRPSNGIRKPSDRSN